MNQTLVSVSQTDSGCQPTIAAALAQAGPGGTVWCSPASIGNGSG